MAAVILVVADHEPVRRALAERLEMAFPKYQVIQAADSQEAEAMVLDSPPVLIVLDIGPSAADRFETIHRLKALQPLARIVVWSIHDWEKYQADALAAGATAYVLKEETQDKLLTVLSAML